MYNSNTQIFYSANNKDSIRVSLYDDMNHVTSLSFSNEVYTHRIGLFYMNGWDSVQYRPSIDSYLCKVFDEGEEVITNYEITMNNMGLSYYDVDAVIRMTENEFDEYVFPEEYIGSLSQTELYDEFEYLKNLEEPLDIISLTQEDIRNKLIDILDILEGLYS